MRIAILSYEYPPDTGFGGIGTYSYYQARALARMGHDVHVFAGSTRNGTHHSSHDGVKVTRIKRDGWLSRLLGDARSMRAWWFENRVTTGMSTYRALRAEHAKEPFDFIEAPECGADALVSTTLMRVPTAVRFHSPARLIMHIYGTSRIDRELTSFVEQVAINQAQVLTSCSGWLAREVADKMSVKGKIHVIPNGIDVEAFDRDEGIDVHSRFHLPADKRLVLFANRMEERKGIHLIKTVAERTLAAHPDVAFVFAGRDPSGWMAEKLLPWAEEQQLLPRFRYLGQLNLHEVRACLKASSIFLLPSIWENCPYSCLEAMTAGRAIVASDCSGMPELIDHGRTGLLARTHDADALADALDRFLRDDELRMHCGASARTEVERRLTDTETARQTMSVYQDFLDNRQTPCR
jgi:glycogen(starch) synthase